MANSLYPEYLDRFIRKIDETESNDGDYVMAQDVNELQSAIESMQEALGVNPQGAFINLAQRLTTMDKTQTMSMPSITFYEGNPILINGAVDAEMAAKIFSLFNHVILTKDITNIENYLEVQDVINKAYELNGTVFYVAVNASVLQENLSLDNIGNMLDIWKSKFKVRGIYLYNFGYDHQVNRSRQNELISLARTKELSLMVEAFDLIDIYSNANINSLNPSGVSVNLNATDSVLIKGFAKNTVYDEPQTIKTLIDKVKELRERLSVKVYATTELDAINQKEFMKDYFYINALAILMSLNGYYVESRNKQEEVLDVLPKIPLISGFYDPNPDIIQDFNVLRKYGQFGKMSVDLSNHKFDYEGLKIPFEFIFIGDQKIAWDNIDVSNADIPLDGVDVVAAVNEAFGLQIEGDKVDYSAVGEKLVESLNTLVGSGLNIKISSELVEGMSLDDIKAQIDVWLAEKLQEKLNSGTLDANFNNLFAQFIRGMNAYFENVVAGNVTAQGMDAGIIKTGELDGKLIKTDSIASDSLKIVSNLGINKWAGTAVRTSDLSSVFNPATQLEPKTIYGQKVFRKLEVDDSGSINTSDYLLNVNDYIVLWETQVLIAPNEGDGNFTLLTNFESTDVAALYVNEEPALTYPSNQPVRTQNNSTQYTLLLKPGWNKIQVIQYHQDSQDVSFDIGINLSSYLSKRERDQAIGQENNIIRIDAYADKATVVTGDMLETGSVKADRIDAEDLNAHLVSAGLIEAIEAHIKHLTAESGTFETILSNFLNAQAIDTEIMRVHSKGKTLNPNTGLYEEGFVTIDDGGFTASSMAKTNHRIIEEELVRVTSAVYDSAHDEWVVSSEEPVTVKLKNLVNQEILLDRAYFKVDYKKGQVILETDNITKELSVNLSEYSRVIASYTYSEIQYPATARLIQINKEGLFISKDGGRTWDAKITGDKLFVGGTDIVQDAIGSDHLQDGSVLSAKIGNAQIQSAHILEVIADKIVGGTLDLSKNLTIAGVDGHLILDGSGLTATDDILNPQSLVKVDKEGLKISNDGGVTWAVKITGDRMSVDDGDINDVTPEKLRTGSLDVSTRINIAGRISMDGTNGIFLNDALGNPNILLKENIYVTNGFLAVQEGVVDRVKVGQYETGKWGIKITTADNKTITLSKDGLKTSTGKFSIDSNGDATFAGVLNVDTGFFGTELSKIAIDQNGLVLGSGSIVDIRDAVAQKLNISSAGIIAKAGKIGDIEITPQGLASATKGYLIGQQIIVEGKEAVLIKDGSMVIKNGDNTYLTIGDLTDKGKGYGILTELYNGLTRSGANILLNEEGLLAYKIFNEMQYDVFRIDQHGNLMLTGEIHAVEGELQNLTVSGSLTLTGVDGKVIAGNTVLNASGIDAKAGSIGGWSLSGDKIISNGDKVLLDSSGKIVAPGVVIGEYGLNLSGILATAGKIGGWTINNSSLVSDNITIDSENNKITVKNDSAVVEVEIGEYESGKFGVKAGNVYLDKDGLKGQNFTLNSSGIDVRGGVIGDWVIDSNYISADKIQLDGLNKAIWIGDKALGIDNAITRFKNDGTAKIGQILLNDTVGEQLYTFYTPKFFIKSNGDVEVVGKVTATSGSFTGRIEATEGWFGTSISGVQVDATGVKAGSVLLNNSGMSLNTTSGGTLTINGTGISIVESGATFATQINLGGRFIANKDGLTATAGSIAGWVIGSSQISKGKMILDSSLEQIKIGDNILIGKDGADYKIKVGTNTTLDDVNGIVTTKGNIGGWIIGADGLTNGNVSIKPSVISLGTNLVLNADGSAKLGAFNVKTNGEIYSGVSDVNFNFKVLTDGTITSKKGSIGGWTINSTELSGTAIKLLPSGAITIGSSNQIVLDSTLGIDVGAGMTTISLAGRIDTGNLNADGGQIANWNIGVGSLASADSKINLDSTNGVIVIKDAVGTDVAKLGKFTHNAQNKYGLYAQDGVIAGWLVSQTGFSIPGITLESSPTPQIKINDTVFLKGDGNVILNAQTNFAPTGSAKIGQLLIDVDGSVRNTNDKFVIDASGNVRIVGEITASTGNIGGWLIQDKQLISSNITFRADDVNSYIGIGTNIKLNNDGTATLGSLKVLSNGLEMVDTNSNKALTFDKTTGNLVIKGDITSTSGKIGNWIINADGITSPEIEAGKVIKLYSGASSALFIGGTTEVNAPIWLRNDGVGKIGILELNKTVEDVDYTLYSDNFKIDSEGNGYFNGALYTNQGEVAGWKVSGSKIYVNSSVGGDLSELGLDAFEKRFYMTDSTGALILAIDGDDGINIRNKFTVDTQGNLVAKSGIFGLSATDGVRVASDGLEVFGALGKITAGDAKLTNTGLVISGTSSSIQLGPSAEFKVTGAGVLTAKSGTIAGWTIDSTKFSGGNVQINSTGEIVLGSRDLVLSSTTGLTTTKTTIELDGKITTDQIEADGGVIAGWTIQPGSLSTGNLILDSTNNRITVGTNVLRGDNSAKIGALTIGIDGSISSANNSFTINGTTGAATFNGTVTASAGTIAGWNITATELVDSLSKIILSPTTGIKVGGTNFTVDLNGLVKATSGRFGSATNYVSIDASGLDVSTGRIKVGAVTLDTNGITAPGFTLDTNGLALTQGTIVLPGVSLTSTGLSMVNGSINLGAGKFTADDAGRITAILGTMGGWTLANNKLTAGTITLNATTGAEAITIGTNIALNQNGSAKLGAITISNAGQISTINNTFTINATTGAATFNGNIASTSGNIGGWVLSATELQGTNLKLNSTGSITIGDPLATPIVIDSSLGILMDNTAIELDGTITTSSIVATGGEIGNWILTDSKLTAGNITLDATTGLEKISISDKIALNNDGSAKIGVLNITSTGAISTVNNKFTVDATGNVVVNGNITSSTGNIGGWALASGGMTAGNISLISTAGSEKISIGSNIALNNDGSAKFGNVTIDTAGNVTMSGAVTSTSGTIAGWTLAANSLTNGNIGIYSGASARIQLGTNLILRNDGSAKIGIFDISTNGTMTSTGSKFTIDGVTGNVSLNGAITSTSGAIGGWTLGSTGLTATGISITSGATPKIQLGTTVTLNGTGAATIGVLNIATDGRINTTNNNFVVDVSGNVTIAGKLTAGIDSNIGGWIINADSIRSSAANAKIVISSNTSFAGIYIRPDGVNDAARILQDGSAMFGPVELTTAGVFQSKTGSFKIATDGNAEFTGKVTANSGAIGALTIATDGTLSTSNGSFSINGTTGAASFNGSINSTSGQIGGWNIGVTSLVTAIANKLELNSAGSIKIGDGSSYKITLDNTGMNINNAFTVNMAGQLTATTGYFGTATNGIQLTSNKLSVIGTGEIGSSDGAVKITSSGIAITKGSITLGTNFILTDTGVITANSGNIAGWSIDASKIYTTDVELNKNGTLRMKNASLVHLGGDATNYIKIKSDTGIDVNNKFFVDQTGSMTATAGSIGAGVNKISISSEGLNVGSAKIVGTRFELADKTFIIKDNVAATRITLGEYVDNSVTYYGLKGDGLTLDSRGLRLSSLSDININDVFKVSNTGVLTATGANISGAITATSGSFTGTINASAGSFTGEVTVGASGIIAVKSGPTYLVKMDSTGLTLNSGSINIGSGKFTVGTDGTMNATGATISGNLTATTGAIAGWTISGNTLVSTGNSVVLDGANKEIKVGNNISIKSGATDYIQIVANSADTTRNKVVLENGAIKVYNASGVVSTALDAAGLYGQLITNQSITSDKFDQVAPAQVTGVTATSYVVQIATGEEVGMNITWTAVTKEADNVTDCTDLAGYKIYIRDITKGDTDYYPVAIAYTNKYQLKGLRAGAQYGVKVSAYDKIGNEGLASVIATHTMTKDTTAPAKVVISKVLPGFKTLGVYWTAVADVDLDFYEVERAEKLPIDPTWSAWTLVNKSNSTTLIDSDLNYDMQYKYRIRGVDLSGNLGTYSNETTPIQPSKIGKADIVAGTITAEEMNIGSVVKSINTQKTTLFHFDGTLQSSQGMTPYMEVLQDGTKVPHQEGFFRKDARFGASVSIEEATVNLIAQATENNANFRDNIRGWTLSAGAQYIDHDGIDGVDDGYIKVAYDWGTYVLIDVENNPTEDIYYTVSMYAKSESNHLARVDIKPMDGDISIWTSRYPSFSGGLAKSIIGSTATTNEWQRYSNVFFIPAGSGTTKLRIVPLAGTTGHTPSIDNVQVEKRRFATSFVNGTKPQGYIDYENNNLIKPDKGVMSFWMYNNIGWKTTSLNSDGSTTDNLFMIGTPNNDYDVDNNSLYAKFHRGSSTLSIKYNGLWSSYTFGSDIADKDWVHVVYTWTTGSQKLYINGKEVASQTATAITTFSDKLFRLGYMPRFDTTEGRIVEEHETHILPYEARANCLFDELRIDKDIVNVEEIKSWFLQESSFYDAASQIDADSQNISAANASVVINNEGITVRDGKIDVSSQDGQVLITGGRLMVNGLDVGVAQSDNNVYNGNFTIEDSLYGIGDLKQTQRGIEQFGAKYWKTRRSKTQKYDNAYLSVSWNNISVKSLFDEQVIWNAIEDAIYLQAVAQYFQVTEAQINPIASFYPWTLAPADSPTKLFVDGLNVAYNMAAPVKSEMVQRVTEFIGLNSMAYHLGQKMSTNAEDVIALRAFISGQVDLFYDHMWTDGTTPFSYLSGGVVVPALKPAYVEIILGTIVQASSQARYGLLASIYDITKLKFDNLMNFKMGYIQWNNADATQILKPYMIMTKYYKDTVYTPMHGDICVENGLYEVDNLAINKVLNGQSITQLSLDDVMADFDMMTGLPKVLMTNPILPGDGGTYFHSAINSHHVGRYGYAELGVQGEEEMWVSLEQDVSRLICYTDGMQPDGTHFKQNNFSMHYIWDGDEFGNPKKSEDARLKFEIEEMIPRFTVVNDRAFILPSYTFEANSKDYYLNFQDPMLGGMSRVQAYINYVRFINPTAIIPDPELIPHEDLCLIHNTVVDMTGKVIQAMEIGHSEYVNGTYKVCSSRNAETIIMPNGAPYTHVGLQMTGEIVNGTCYYLTDENGNPDLGKELTIEGEVYNKYVPVIKLIDYSTKPGWQNDASDHGWIMGNIKMGDEVTIIWNGNFEVDAKITSPHGPDHGTFDLLVNRVPYQVGTINNPNYSMQKLYDITGFFSGALMLTFVNKGQRWMDAPAIEDQYAFVGAQAIKMFDYHSLKEYAQAVNPAAAAMIDWTKNIVVTEEVRTDEWNPAYILPKIANSKINGVPLLPEATPVKYKVKVKLEKDDTSEVTANPYNDIASCKVTAIQAELGKNPSYHRLSYGEGSVSGIQLQSYNKMFWILSGIKTRHFEEHMPGYHRETGVYTRHLAERTITSSKIAYEGIKNDNVANNNISYNKVRLQKKILEKHTCSLTDFADWHYSGDDREMIDCYELRPGQTPISNKYYILDAIDYNSEMLYENGQLIYGSDDYTVKKKLGTCLIRDLSLVAGLYGEFLYSYDPGTGNKTYTYPLLQNLYVTGARRPLTQDELIQFSIAIEATDLYEEVELDTELKESKAHIYEVTEIQLSIEPDQSDKYLVTYWVEP